MASENDIKNFSLTGQRRDLNRKKFNFENLSSILDNTDCNATLTSSVSNTETVIHHSGMMDVEISDSMIWHTRMASGYEYYEQTT